MRIAIDLQCCQTGSSLGGIGRYSLDLAKAMIAQGHQHEFFIILNNLNGSAHQRVSQELSDLLPLDNIKTLHVPSGIASIKGNIPLIRQVEFLRLKFIESLNVDVVHISSLIEGLYDNVVLSIADNSELTPCAVTLYDLIPHTQRELYLQDANARTHYYSKLNQIKNSKAILAISDYTAAEAASYFSDFSGPIVNIRGGVSPEFKIIKNSYAVIAERCKHWGIKSNYLLYVASFDLRKNQDNLIRAYAQLPPNERNDLQLVLVGSGWPDIYNHLKSLAKSCGLDDNSIVFTGRVSNDELCSLYNCCSLFVYPPLWEGLGMPPLEAMACGALAIGSNTTSIPEVIGLNEALFDPTDPSDIAKLINRGLNDPFFRLLLAENSKRQLEQYRWSLSASITLNTLQLIARTNVADNDTDKKSYYFLETQFPILNHEQLILSQCNSVNNVEKSADINLSFSKVAWVSSWGTKCGIASYTRNLVLSSGLIHKIFASTISSNAAHSTDHSDDDAGSNVVRCWNQGKTDTLTGLELELISYNPDAVFIQFNFGFFNFQYFSKLLSNLVNKGIKVYITLHSTLDQSPSLDQRLPSIVSSLELCDILFVHKPEDKERLFRLGLNSNVIVIPQSAPSYENDDQPTFSNFSIASYGFFLPGKGLTELVKAIHIIHEAGYPDVRLDMINANYGDAGGVSQKEIDDVKALIENMQMGHYVRLNTEYLTDNVSISLLKKSSIIVFPYQKTGESSSAAVRMGLCSGRLVAITPNQIFSDVKSFTIVLPGLTPFDIAAGLIDIIKRMDSDPDYFEPVKISAARWCDTNRVENIWSVIKRSIVRSSLKAEWLTVFEPKIDNLPNQGALFTRNLLSFSSTSDGVLYGPYINLEPGIYRLEIFGFAEWHPDCNHGSLSVSVNVDGGSKSLFHWEITSSANGLLFSRLFEIKSHVNGVEFVIRSKNINVEVKSYSLKRRMQVGLNYSISSGDLPFLKSASLFVDMADRSIGIYPGYSLTSEDFLMLSHEHWHSPEAEFVWSKKAHSVVNLSVLLAQSCKALLEIDFSTLLIPNDDRAVKIVLVGNNITRLGPFKADGNIYQIQVCLTADDLFDDNTLRIEFDIDYVCSPLSLGMSIDSRELGILLKKLRLRLVVDSHIYNESTPENLIGDISQRGFAFAETVKETNLNS